MVSDIEIYMITNKYKTLLNEMDEIYICIRTLIIDDNLIEKYRIHTNFFLRELKWPITPSVRLLENHIMNHMISIQCGIADKTEDHIEKSHQIGKRFERRYQCVTDITQS